MHVQDENKLTIKTIGRFCHNRGHSGWWSGKFRLPLENDGILDWDRNFPLQHATYGPLKELMQRFLTCKERDTPFTRGIGFNVPIMTGRDCELDTSRTAKRTPNFVLLPVGRRPSDHISFPKSPLRNFKLETTEIHLCDQTNRHVSSQPDTFIRSRAQFLLCSLDMKTGFLCKRKTFKKKQQKTESSKRVDSLLSCAY